MNAEKIELRFKELFSTNQKLQAVKEFKDSTGLCLREAKEFWNYFTHRFTTAVVEGINRGIKTLKWVAYGYKDMAYFALKIMQKFGYLNHKYALNWLYPQTQ